MRGRLKKISYWWYGVAFFAVGLILWMIFAQAAFLSIPKDFSYQPEIISTDDFFDPVIGQYRGTSYSKSEFGYKTLKTEGHNSIIQNFFNVETLEDKPVYSVEREYGINRRDGAHVPGLGDRERTGYLFAPGNLREGATFIYWHPNYDAPAHMKFVDKDAINNVKVYRYETRYDNKPVDQTKELGHLPGVGKTLGINTDVHLTLWIEPTTGRIIDFKDESTAYYYDLSTGKRLYPWNHFSNTIEDDSVEGNAAAIRGERAKVQVVSQLVPLVLLIFTLLCAAQALGLGRWFTRHVSGRTALAITGSLVLVLGAITLFMWAQYANNPAGFTPPTINPITSLLFAILGIGLIFKERGRGRIAAAAGIILLSIGVLRILSQFGLISFQIDLIFFKDAVLNAPVTARMAEFTAMSAILLGVTLIAPMFSSLRKVRMAEITSLVAFVLSIVALCSLLFDSIDLFLTPQFFLTSTHATILFFVSAAVLYAHARRHSDFNIHRAGWTTITLLVFLFIWMTVALAGRTDNAFVEQANEKFDSQVDLQAEGLVSDINVSIGTLQGSKGLFAASDDVDSGEWKRFFEALDLEENHPYIKGMGFAPLVASKDLQTFTAAARAQETPNYTVHPASPEATYYPILFLEPHSQASEGVLGLDFYASNLGRKAIEQSRDSGSPRMTGKINISQTQEERPGFLVTIPVYKNGLPQATVEEKRQNIQGVVFDIYDSQEFFAESIDETALEDIALTVYADAKETPEAIMYDDTDEKLKPNETPRFEEAFTTYIAGQPWTLHYRSTEDYGATNFVSRLSLSIILAGLAISMLIALIFYTLFASRQTATEYADKVTKDLRDANKELEEAQHIGRFGSYSWDLRAGKMVWSDETFRLHGLQPRPDHLAPSRPDYDKLVYPEDLRSAQMNVAKVFKTHKGNQGVYRVVWPDGSIHYMQVSAGVDLDPKGQLAAIKGTFQDVTHEKEVEKTKDEFVSLASHQLRSPLSAIGWYVEMLLAGDAGQLTDEQKQFMQEISDANKRMSDLVGALLNTSRLDMGTFAIEPEPTDIIKLAQSVIAEQKPMITQKNLNVITQFGAVPIMQADPRLLRMVLQNLVSNALKYTPEKGTVTVEIKADDKQFGIRVADTGYGIPAGQQEKIFSKLYRAENVKQKNVEGTGLGLYIIKAVVDQSGGKVWFESEEDKGTTFYVTFPKEGMRSKKGDKKLNE